MSGRNSSDTIAERRLRHVYDFLDSGSNKKAIQEADKVLKKHPNILLAKTLKALALVRLSREGEAWVLIDEVEKEEPVEEHTLQALTHCFKDLARHDRITKLYESVCARTPQNEEFLTQLFMSYVRLRDYKKQQQTAMQIYRTNSQNPYYFWAVMSIIMQAIQTPSHALSMLYPLAEKMVRKFSQEDKIQAEAEVMILLLILEKQNKHSEALELLQSGLAEKYLKNMWDREYRIIGYLKELGQWKEIHQLCVTNIPHKMDDWRLYTSLFESTLALIGSNPDGKEEWIQLATDVVLTAVSQDKNSERHVRGPYLARLQLILCLLEQELVVRAELGEPLGLLSDYFRVFGHKPCCFSDMRPYLCLLGEQQQDEFLCSVISDVNMDTISATDAQPISALKNDIQKHVCFTQLNRCLGRRKTLSGAEKLELAKEYIRRHRESKEKDGGGKSSEIPPGDFYLILAVQYMWDVYNEHGDSQLLQDMVVLLEVGLAGSPSNFHFKYILTKLYGLLGAGVCVDEMICSLDIKYVQKDTLGYLIYDQFSPFGLYETLTKWMECIEHYFVSSQKELLDCLAQAYKNGSFCRIPEIVDYDDQSQRSFHRVASLIARGYFTVISQVDSVELLTKEIRSIPILSPYKDGIEWGKLTDNRDYACLPSWDPSEADVKLKDHTSQSFKETLDVLKFRHLVLRMLGVLCSEVEKKGEVDNLQSLLSQLAAHHRHCRSDYGQPILTSAQGPMSSHFDIYLEGGYFDVLYTVLNCAHCILRCTKQGEGQRGNSDCANGLHTEISNQKSEPMLETFGDHASEHLNTLPTPENLQGLFRRMFSSHQFSGVSGGTASPPSSTRHGNPSSGFPYMQLIHISFLLQTLSLCLVVAQLSSALLFSHCPNTTSGGKKNKKKQHSRVHTTNGVDNLSILLMTQFRDLIEVICSAPNSVRGLLDDMEIINETAIDSTIIKEADFLTEETCPNAHSERIRLQQRLRASYKKSITEMQSVANYQQKLAEKLNKSAK